MIKWTWKIFTPIISALIGILAANQLNIFALIPFVPTDYLYEVCITAYFAIADVVLDALQEHYSEKISKWFYSELEVIIFQPGTSINFSTDSVLDFNADDLTEANISVKITGTKKHFKDIDLLIKKPSFAEIQNDSRRREVQIDNENYRIKLAELFGNSDQIECKQEFKIVMIQDPVDGDSSIIMSPELSKKKRNIKYRHNNAKLKAVRR
jgi:hypothetical protein